MSDLSDQISGFQRQWMDQQQQVMSKWFNALQGMGGGTAPDTWQQALDVIEEQVGSTLDIQRQSLMTLAENAENVDGVPESITQWIQQMEAGIAQWNDLQQQLWHTWFDMLRSVAPARENPGDKLVKDWQDFAKRAMEIQENWFSTLAEIQPDTKKSTRKKSSKTTSSGTQADNG